MSYDPSRDTLLGYVDRYAKIYKKIHAGANELELIQEISLNLGQRIVLKLNQLSSDWKTIDKFEVFRDLISRLEKDIMALENELNNQTNQDLASTVNKLVASALAPPLTEFKELINRLSQKSKEDPGIENVAAIKHGGYPDSRSDERERRDFHKRKSRDWDKKSHVDPAYDSERPQGVFRKAKELKKAYEDKYGEVYGPCFYCSGHHFRRHCPLEISDLKELGDRQ